MRSPASNDSPAKDSPPLGDAGATAVSSRAPAGSKYSILAEPVTSTSVKTTPKPWVVAGVEVPGTKKWLS